MQFIRSHQIFCFLCDLAVFWRKQLRAYRRIQNIQKKISENETGNDNDELVRRNEHLQKQGRGLRPLMIITLVTALANIVLAAAQIAGLF